MKKLLIVLTLFSSLFVVFPQQKSCDTDERMRDWFSKHPEKFQEYRERQRKEMKYTSETVFSGEKKAAPVYTIPVVFHILHMGGAENISDAQVVDAVNILTRDFRKKNPDTVGIQTVFKNIAADAEIEFVLATKDPNGNCTNGIVRHYDPHTNWTGDPSEYVYTWPPHQYLNIYVVKTINSNAAGYTYFPGSTGPSMDAIVILSNYVGSIGTSNPGLSRALTHEVGHWLDLPHVWGFNNSPGQTCGDDGINDTPVTKGWNNCNLTNNDVCNPGIKENVENYMEYAYCQKMFTLGQANHMKSTLMSTVANRQNLWTNSNLIQTGVINPSGPCAPQISLVSSPGSTLCAGSTVAVLAYTSNGTPTTYSWSCSGSGSVLVNGLPQATIFIPQTGNYTVICTASNVSGASTSSLVVQAVQLNPVINAGQTESFESSSLPNGWSLPNNISPSQNWKQTNAAASDGLQSVYIQGETLPQGKHAVLQTPPYDFKNNPGAGLSFKYAYARKTSSTVDVLRVYASKDCGGSWQMILSLSATYLSNGSGGVDNAVFFPTSSQWKTYQIDMHPNFYPYLFEPQVLVRFDFQEDSLTGFQNRFYLDEVNFTTPMGISKISSFRNFCVYPNPAKDAIKIRFSDVSGEKVRLLLKDLTGKVIFENEILVNPFEHENEIPMKNWPAGVYILECLGKNRSAFVRIIKE